MAHQLELDRVGVTFDHTRVLDGVSLSLSPGVTALVGRNGAGKTTLIRAVVGTVTPSAGRVLRLGADIGAGGKVLADHRRRLGWLPQEPGFPPRMKVLDFLRYAAWLKDLPRGEQEAAATAALDHGDLGHHSYRRIGELSGGQRRRTALAAALIGSPSLLVLDEPTNGLDPFQRERLLGLVRDLGSTSTVLLATHLLEDVGLIADTWISINAGRVTETGTIDRSSPVTVSEGLSAIRSAVAIGAHRDE